MLVHVQPVEKKRKPMLISRKDGQPFAFAGLKDRWRKGTEVIKSCTIITTEANDFMKPVHTRMPVILSPENYDLWLTCKPVEAEQLLQRCSMDDMTMIPVGKTVNSSRNDVPECVEPVAGSSLF